MKTTQKAVSKKETLKDRSGSLKLRLPFPPFSVPPTQIPTTTETPKGQKLDSLWTVRCTQFPPTKM